MKPLRVVFAIVSDCHASSGHYRALWQRHFYDGLRGAVSRLIIPVDVSFDWSRGGAGVEAADSAAPGAATSQKLWEQIETAHHQHGLDAVISYCYSRELDPRLVKDTIQFGVPWINFYCDSIHRFSEVANLAGLVSLNWFPERAALPKYRALNVRAACLPYALNPDELPDLTCRQARRQVVFVGLPTTNRITQLGLLRLWGCRVDVRGHGWIGAGDDPFYSAISRRQRLWNALVSGGLTEKVMRRLVWPLVRRQAGGSLDDTEYFDFLRESQVVLGLNQSRDERGRFNSYLKLRDLEFPGYGCCYLTEHNEDVAAALEAGTEVLTYQSLPEAAAHLRALRRNPERARRVGARGRARVLTRHTWRVRLLQLAEAL